MAVTKVLPGGGLAVKVVGSQKTKRQLELLPVLVQRKILRLAVAAGARPVADEMRGRLRRISAASKRHEGIGTAARSIVVKTASKKSDPNVAYAVVGARRGYGEIATLRAGVSAGHSAAVKNVTAYKVIKRGRRGSLRVNLSDNIRLSPSARKARLRPTKGLRDLNKRVPSRYLHMLERGRYVRPPHWTGWHFAERTARRLAGTVNMIIRRQIIIGLQREMKRAA